jgi:ribosome-associated translation inhibitor RaiA
MENLEFVLGMLTAIGVFGLGYAIVGIVKVKQRSNDFEEVINGTQLDLDNNQREIHLRVDQEVKNLEDRVDDLYRHIDSRFDKFENRITKIDKDGCEPVKTSKQVLTD